MKPEWSNGVVDIYRGDARDVLSSLGPESVHCVVTSPPYWGLRDYGIEPQVWSGDAACVHEWLEHVQPAAEGTRTLDGNSALRAGHQGTASATMRPKVSAFCACNAWRGSLGLEPTPELYVQHVVEIFREARRVLRADGTLWLNLGDSYAAGGNGSRDPDRWPKQSRNNNGDRIQHAKKNAIDLKPKDLVGIPWRVAFALQADGWYLRSDIIWSKPNPMPESVNDRPTKAHEYVFLLSKSERYYYDAQAIREESSLNTHRRAAPGKDPSLDFKMEAAGSGNRNNPSFQAAMKDLPLGSGRNKRSVWEIATQPYPAAHFATFPTKLVEPCVLGGTSEWGVCAKCGAPYQRVVKQVESGRTQKMADGWDSASGGHSTIHRSGREAGEAGKAVMESITTGWRKTCSHRADVVPATVLDPFAGSGTVGEVAQTLGRKALLIEVNPEYVELSKKRIEAVSLPMKMG